MKSSWAALLAVMAMTLAAGAARAQEWVQVGEDVAGIRYDVDVGAVVRNGDIVQSWMRSTPKRAQREPGGKSYNYSVSSRFDDCKGQRSAVGEFLFYTQKGAVVANYPDPREHQFASIPPGSVGAAIATAICGLGAAETVDSILEGSWKNLGVGVNPSYTLHIMMDSIIEVDSSHRLVFTRADYAQYQYQKGVPFRYLIVGNLVDCKKRQTAQVETYAFITPTRQVDKIEVKEADIRFQPLAPGSFAYLVHDEVCSAETVPLDEAGADPKGEGGISFGTAWATNKGYLVTASHVIAGRGVINVYQNSQKVGTATVVADDPANDLAVLKFTPASGAKLKIIPLSDRPGTLGRSVFTLGYPAPDVLGQRVKMASGEISSTAGLQDDARFLQISIPIQQGNSGGPVMGFDGTAVGVVDAKLTKFGEDKDQPRPEMVNYAVKIAYLRPLLDDLPDLQNYVPLKAKATPDDLIDEAREAVFMLVVQH